MKTGIINFFLIIPFFFILSCNSSGPEPMVPDPNTPYQTTAYPFETPLYFPQMEMSEVNPLTVEGVALGRMLYYDPIMDKKGTRSCSSCHDQSISFQVENGINQVVPHINIGWNNRFMWDGGFEGTLEDVMLFEVDVFFETDINKLNANANYRKLFKNAFNVDTITSLEASYALAQFARTMTSSNSRYDQLRRQETTLTTDEMTGLMLFFTEKGDCFHCHLPELFTDNTPRNNGLDIYPDSGLFAITKDPKDFGKFKTPTLRNIELTAPYMHDGRFSTLKEVVAFYAYGVNNTDRIDPLMVHSHIGGNKLTEEEQWQLVAFLKTLTDEEFITRSELGSPF